MPVIILPYRKAFQAPIESPATLYFDFNSATERETGTPLTISSGAVIQNGEIVATDSNPLVTFSYSALALGTGNFTIEMWYTYGTADSSYQGIFTAAPSTGGVLITVDGGYVRALVGDNVAKNLITTSPVKLGAQSTYHIALVRNSGVVSLYIDGIQTGNTLINNVFNLSNTSGKFFARYTNSTGFNIQYGAKIKEFRIVPSAVYTGNFIPTNPIES